MSFALLDCTTWADGYDFTGDSNKITLSPELESKDGTVFGGDGWRTLAGGLKSAAASLEGFWQGPVDAAGFDDLGNADRVVTVSPTGLVASPAFMFQATKLKYSAFGQVGELTPFTLDLSGSNTVGMVRGQVAAAKQSVSAIGALGSAVNLGAPAAGQYVYAALHVFGTPGTTITVQVQSDDNSGMTTPTTRGTIGPLTAAGGAWLARVAGPFASETYWRLNVSAVTGTFTVAGAIAVQ